MAQQMVCDGCEAEPAVVVITSIGNGEIKAVGADCLPMWAAAMAEAFGYSPPPPGQYPPTETPETPDDPAHPHAPAETGPGTYGDESAPDPDALPADHPHAPAETGPSHYGDEGGQTGAPDPNEPTPTEIPAEFAPGEAPDPGASVDDQPETDQAAAHEGPFAITFYEHDQPETGQAAAHPDNLAAIDAITAREARELLAAYPANARAARAARVRAGA